VNQHFQLFPLLVLSLGLTLLCCCTGSPHLSSVVHLHLLLQLHVGWGGQGAASPPPQPVFNPYVATLAMRTAARKDVAVTMSPAPGEGRMAVCVVQFGAALDSCCGKDTDVALQSCTLCAPG